jgi:hypothetical protein
MSVPGECCIAGADGQSWPCRSAWLVASGSGSLVELEWLDEVVACSPKRRSFWLKQLPGVFIRAGLGGACRCASR